MPAHDLGHDRSLDIRQVEDARLRRVLGVEHDLEQQVAQLLGELGPDRLIERVVDLVRLLQQERPQRAVVLLPVPGAATGRPQPRHEPGEAPGAGRVEQVGDGRQQVGAARQLGRADRRRPSCPARHPAHGPDARRGTADAAGRRHPRRARRDPAAAPAGTAARPDRPATEPSRAPWRPTAGSSGRMTSAMVGSTGRRMQRPERHDLESIGRAQAVRRPHLREDALERHRQRGARSPLASSSRSTSRAFDSTVVSTVWSVSSAWSGGS